MSHRPCNALLLAQPPKRTGNFERHHKNQSITVSGSIEMRPCTPKCRNADNQV
ncbi:uncharacterized protein LACBIDRAFT_299453 [Laccaria bicolor S238N-H82]|uniref:Predicted protein n=1 Tax=Laccaria bicolor (strain S238N-H82 / ATCC MYA-4686) TaxID=486041 RepID=B0DER0_LACBS|nr:uncharacterized protein LACBIDRAFT_299453 [Laccaria bicolor S238N-H82]EDR07071.1 predicted protein [Laccaria bicolor S238N-H82]|eukprot:XP_001882444.1 predicted protein [Laccaria bicolor S238N-H82]